MSFKKLLNWCTRRLRDGLGVDDWPKLFQKQKKKDSPGGIFIKNLIFNIFYLSVQYLAFEIIGV